MEQNRKANWFWLVTYEMLDLERLLPYSCCYFSLWMFVARISTWPDRRKRHYSGSSHMWAAHYKELRWPLTTPALKLQRKQKEARVQRGVCFVCSHGGLPLDAFIISLSDATVPRGGDVTARSMSNMKEGEVAARDLWRETNLTRSVLRGVAGRHHVAHPPTCLHIRPTVHTVLSANQGLLVWGLT